MTAPAGAAAAAPSNAAVMAARFADTDAPA